MAQKVFNDQKQKNYHFHAVMVKKLGFVSLSGTPNVKTVDLELLFAHMSANPGMEILGIGICHKANQSMCRTDP